jgi:DNA-binding MarR family transcriptional regulator
MLDQAVYARLLALRTALRRFEQWSADQARAAGLTPAQHQLLLAIKGHADPRGPTVTDVADYLLLKHHSAVGLIDRAVEAGLIVRERSGDDQRVVHLRLTRSGAQRLRALSELHLEELRHLVPMLAQWEAAAEQGAAAD